MDEPLSNLDAKLRVSMRAQLTKLHERLGVTTVYVTHDQVEAMTLGTRVAVLRDGVLQQCDTPQELFHHPANLFVAAFIGSPAMNLVEADVAGDEVAFGGYRAGAAARTRRCAARDRRVILGVRPTDFEAAGPATDPALPRDAGHGRRGRAARLREPPDLRRSTRRGSPPRPCAPPGRRGRRRRRCCSPTTRARSSPRASTGASRCAPATR